MMKVCEEGYLAHVYYGNKVPDEDLTYLLRLDESPFTPATNDRDRASFMDTLPLNIHASVLVITESLLSK